MAASDISHSGKIVSIDPDFITVEFVSESACATCHASGFCGTAEATLLLWKGGAVSAGIRMGKYHSQSGYLELNETQNLIKDDVNILCYGIILSHALIQVQKENLDIAKDHLKEIQQKYKQGLASDLDVLNQKVKVYNRQVKD